MLLFFAVFAGFVAPAVTAWVMTLRKPAASMLKLSLLSALPVPVMLWGVCLFLYMRAYLSSPEQCGTDGCTMTMFSAIYVAAMVFILFLIAWIVAAFAVWNVRRGRAPVDAGNTFE